MSYEKQTWAKGDIVTSAKLNHMEDGIADKSTQMGVLAFATADENDKLTLDRTWQEAVDSKVTRIVVDSEKDGVAMREYYIVLEVIRDSGQDNYIIVTKDSRGSALIFKCHSPNGYPTSDSE